MFNFTTQSVYNNIVSSVITEKGQTPAKGANLIISKVEDTKPFLRIGNTRFDTDLIEDVQVKLPTKENLACVTFDLGKLIEKAAEEGDMTARFVLYIGLSMNDQSAFYANDYVYKGKPLFIEFPVKKTDTSDTLAARIKKIAKKYLLLMMGTEKILDITTEASSTEGNTTTEATLTFTGINGYQQIRHAILQVWDPDATTVDCCTNSGAYVDFITGVPVMFEISQENDDTNGCAVAIMGSNSKPQKLTEDGPEELDDETEVAILPGLEAFGDYNWIIHNLRLPTAANYYPWSPANRMGENPVPGQEYTQFIIRMKKDRDGIAGGAVGMRVTSVTTHVLYVAGKAALDDSVETTAADKVYKALFHATNGLNLGSKKFVDADTALNQPYASVED